MRGLREDQVIYSLKPGACGVLFMHEPGDLDIDLVSYLSRVL